MDNVGAGQTKVGAAAMKMLVAIERFKSDLSSIELDETEIREALEDAVNRALTNPYDLITALRIVADEKVMTRTRRWDSEIKDANSYTALTKGL